MMRIPLLLMHFFVILQLLAVLAHARTESSNLKMPTSLDQPPSLCFPGSSLCRKFVSITQYKRPAASPPPSPGSPSGGQQSPRPSSSSPAKRLRSSPCLAKGLRYRFKKNYHGKRPSSRKDSHPCSTEEKSLCHKFLNMRHSTRPSLSPPPPPPPIPYGPVQSWSISPPSLSLASS